MAKRYTPYRYWYEGDIARYFGHNKDFRGRVVTILEVNNYDHVKIQFSSGEVWYWIHICYLQTTYVNDIRNLIEEEQ